MKTYIPYFKYVGIQDIWFEIEPKSTPLQIANQTYSKRTLIYHVKLERKYYRRQGEAYQNVRIIFDIDGITRTGIPGIYNELQGEELPK